MKPNGQDEAFSGYGGIEDPDLHCRVTAGDGWTLSREVWLPGVADFPQSRLEPGTPNCVLVSLARVLLYHAGHGYAHIPMSPEEIYPNIRAMAVRHGYDPGRSGLFYDLFVYTPFAIGPMASEAWLLFGYPRGNGRSRYLRRLHHLRNSLDNSRPALLNLSFGDYPSHTITVTGYRTYIRSGSRPRWYLRVFDGWCQHVRYLDWGKACRVPSSVTLVLPPDLPAVPDSR